MSSSIRRLQSILLLALVIGLLASPLVAQAQEKSLVWDRFDVDILVKADGTFDVAEHQRIRFTAGSFTFGFRELPVSNFDYADNWAVTDSSGNRYELVSGGSQPYTFTVDDSGYKYGIRWYFPAASDTTETYSLSYTVHGGLRYYDAGDQLWWKAIYSDRSFPVLNGRVNVFVPAEVQEWAAYINGRDAKDSASATLLEGKKTVVFDLDRRLNSGQDFEVRVQFPHGVVAGTVQSWQTRADQQVAAREAEQAYLDRWGPIATLGFGALGALFLFGGPALLYLLWYKLGRDKPVDIVADYLPEPPDDLPPGVAGVLLDEQVDMEDIIATLVDLARRKAISITEEKKGRLLTSTDFIYRRERDDVPLTAFEEELLKAVFGRKQEVELSDLKNKFYQKIGKLKKSLYADVTERQLFVRNPESVRNQYGCLGVLLLGLAGVAAFALVGVFGDLTAAAFLPGFGMGVTAFGFLLLSRFMPKKTDSGSEASARWQAFKRYLKDIDRYTDLDAQKEIWDRWLPYAIAFGVDKEYIRKFEKIDAPAPGWYIPDPTLYGPYRRWYYGSGDTGPMTAGSGGGLGKLGRPGSEGGSLGGGLSEASRGMGNSLTSMSAGLGAMLSSASTTMTSRPA
ncbi:MAG: DUF2207 domain-containing protein, partial [Caldilineaceae bacterium]